MIDMGKILEILVNNSKTLKRIAYLVLVLTVVIDFFIPRKPYHIFFWDQIPGFNAVYGFVGCVLIVVISKALGRYWLERPEDHYRPEDHRND